MSIAIWINTACNTAWFPARLAWVLAKILATLFLGLPTHEDLLKCAWPGCVFMELQTSKIWCIVFGSKYSFCSGKGSL